MNSKLKIALIVGVVMLVCGVAISGAGFAMGGLKDVVFSIDGVKVFDPKVIDFQNAKELEKVDETFEDVSSIDIHVDSINKITIKKGATLTVKGQNLTFFGGLKAERTADGALVVAHSVDWPSRYGVISFQSIFRAATNPYPLSYVEITVPQGASLAAIDLSVSFGDVEINDLTAGLTEVNSDSGSISARDLTCDAFKVTSNYGDTDARNVNAKEVSLTSDSGDIKFRNLTASNDFAIESAYGSVDLEAVNAGAARFQLSSGNFIARNMSVANGMNLSSSYGDIELTGDLRGDSAIESDAGSINLTLYGSEDDYAVSVDSNVGEVTLGDREFSGSGGYFESGPSSAPSKITIRSHFGDVHVGF
jgi:hypothetical protein